MKHFLFTIVIVVCATAALLPQNKGVVTGTITDKNTREPLIGANVVLEGTTLGASADINGNFRIANVPAKMYRLKASFISYNSLIIEKVDVQPGKETNLAVVLTPAEQIMKEVVITADAARNSDAGVLKVQRSSVNLVDGISSEAIKKNNSSDGADVLKVMPGVTISEGKYAYIRGISDRYNNTLFNGAPVAGSDPEKKSFSYDIIPAGLIENVITSKTFSPDKPADFSGGLVQIKTVEFPARFIFDLSTVSGYTPGTTGADYIGYNGGKKDFLGIDDGSRALPSVVPSAKVTAGNFSTSQLQQIGLSFANNWQTRTRNAPLNSGLRLGIGDRITYDDGYFVLGYVGSLSYSNSFSVNTTNKETYTFEGLRYKYNGGSYSNSVLWGAMANLSLRINGVNKISFKNTANTTSDDETVVYTGDYTAYQQYRENTALRFVSRKLYATTLSGEHELDMLHGAKLEWNLSRSISNRNEPDARRYVYSKDLLEQDQPMRLLLDQSLTTRFFGSLDDKNNSAALDFTSKFSDNPFVPVLKTGLAFDVKNRDFSARSFGFRNMPGGNFIHEDSVMMMSIDKIFAPENISHNFIEVSEITKPSDSYVSKGTTSSGYVMAESDLPYGIKISAGVRYEKSVQTLDTKTQTGEALALNITNADLLPGVNVIAPLNESMNLRAAYSKTLARPEFREIAPYSYFDFVTSELVIGNADLKRTLVSNYDFRYEYYPSGGELLSATVFYKEFNNPIEQVLIASSSLEPIRSYRNADKATSYGLELEGRKKLDFISDILSGFAVTANYSLLSSEIKLAGGGFQAGTRPLQGQAKYIVNTGLFYENELLGLNASLTYNRIGEKLAKVGYAGIGDVTELPRDQVDISVTKKLYMGFSLKLTVRDLLAQDQQFEQETAFGKKITERNFRDRGISATLSYQW